MAKRFQAFSAHKQANQAAENKIRKKSEDLNGKLIEAYFSRPLARQRLKTLVT